MCVNCIFIDSNLEILFVRLELCPVVISLAVLLPFYGHQAVGPLPPLIPEVNKIFSFTQPFYTKMTWTTEDVLKAFSLTCCARKSAAVCEVLRPANLAPKSSAQSHLNLPSFSFLLLALNWSKSFSPPPTCVNALSCHHVINFLTQTASQL